MSLTHAVAAAAGAGRKAAQVQLQAELSNDDDWDKFLLRDGLLVVDVYTEWCGPCQGMVGNLKKIKVEIGGDNLHLAVAKSDTIECLRRFRNRSEPTWMFIAGGQLLTVVFGADAPRIARTIEEELRNEELVKKGERTRPQRAPHELTPPEQEAAERERRAAAQRGARVAAARRAARAARRGARAARLEEHFAELCAALVLPHAQKHLRRLVEALEPHGVVVADKCPLVLGRQGAQVLGAEDEEMGSEAVAAVLSERPALALLLKKLPEREGDVIDLARRALCGDGVEQEEGTPKKYLSEELRADDLPGLFVPKDRYQRAAVLDLLFPKMVGALVEPPVGAPPPHVALVLGAWQRRAVLAAAAQHCAPLLLHYGFFADGNVQEPRLLCKTIEQYEERPEKDYCETIVLMVAVGAAEPALAEDAPAAPDVVPPALLALGPLHVSEDSVVGERECARFFPPGYNEPEVKPKPKTKRKKKKRQETKEETEDDGKDVAPEAAEVEGEANGDEDGSRDVEDGIEEIEVDGEGDDGDVEEAEETFVADKATSPPPIVL